MNTLKFNQIEFNYIGKQPSMPLQEKSVTITENGTTEVVPDSGYALEKVKVKVNVPSHEYKYFKTTDEFWDYYENTLNMDAKGVVKDFILTHKVQLGGQVAFTNQNFLFSRNACVAFCMDYSIPLGLTTTLKNMINSQEPFAVSGQKISMSDVLVTTIKITKEEYYSLT